MIYLCNFDSRFHKEKMNIDGYKMMKSIVIKQQSYVRTIINLKLCRAKTNLYIQKTRKEVIIF